MEKQNKLSCVLKYIRRRSNYIQVLTQDFGSFHEQKRKMKCSSVVASACFRTKRFASYYAIINSIEGNN